MVIDTLMRAKGAVQHNEEKARKELRAAEQEAAVMLRESIEEQQKLQRLVNGIGALARAEYRLNPSVIELQIKKAKEIRAIALRELAETQM